MPSNSDGGYSALSTLYEMETCRDYAGVKESEANALRFLSVGVCVSVCTSQGSASERTLCPMNYNLLQLPTNEKRSFGLFEICGVIRF